VKRILPLFRRLRAAAEPRPDDPDNDPESFIELVRQPAVPEVGMPSVDSGHLIDGSSSIVTHSLGF
jgi:hypothetical protein